MRLVPLLVRTNFTFGLRVQLWCIPAIFDTDFFYVHKLYLDLFVSLVFRKNGPEYFMSKNALDQIALCAFHLFLGPVYMELGDSR